ncbi:nucleotidyltransferase [Planctomycetales bacterium]|nr:nucleotidyltransferase [Planctomycetales bacterium]
MSENQDIRWKQRFQNFGLALKRLGELNELQITDLRAIEQEGFVQRFEYTFELAWKTAKDYMQDVGIVFTEVSPRTVIKAAFVAGIIDDAQPFIDMMISRNLLSHTYDFDKFTQILVDVKTKYLPVLEKFYNFLAEKINE